VEQAIDAGVDGYLQLADWRRTVAMLYATVRRLAATDPAAAHAHWCAERERLYREHPQSPVPAAERTAFRARHFPYDAALRFAAQLMPADDVAVASPQASDGAQGMPAACSEIPSSDGGTISFRRIGRLEVPFAAGTRRLGLYWLHSYAGGLFLSFRDATNGAETYGGGRYLLDAAKSADLGEGTAPRTLMLDFNFAYQPSCAFDSRWTCPLTAPENRLDIAIRAGERID